MDVRPGETVIFQGHPSWRSVWRTYLIGVAVALVVGALVWWIVSPLVGVAVGLAVMAVSVLSGLLQRLSTRFVITDQRLYIKRGVLSRFEQQTRLERVQDVSTVQSPLMRLLQIGTVNFDTASNENDKFRFEGVEDPQDVVAAVDEAHRVAADL